MVKQAQKIKKVKPESFVQKAGKSDVDFQAGEKLFCLVCEHSPDIILFVNRDLTITYANAQTEKVLGLRKEEIIGTYFYSYIHPEDRDGALKFLEQFLNETLPDMPAMELRIASGDGNWNTVETTVIRPLHPQIGETIILHFRDLTQIKALGNELEKNRSLYRLLSENITEHVWVMDLKLNLIYISPSVEKYMDTPWLKLKNLDERTVYARILSENSEGFLGKTQSSHDQSPATTICATLRDRTGSHSQGRTSYME